MLIQISITKKQNGLHKYSYQLLTYSLTQIGNGIIKTVILHLFNVGIHQLYSY